MMLQTVSLVQRYTGDQQQSTLNTQHSTEGLDFTHGLPIELESIDLGDAA